MTVYPRNLAEFEERFATEKACVAYLSRLRWPDGFRCPRCQAAEGWPSARARMSCAACGYQASLTAGTIFEGTRKPLRLWFRAIWWVTTHKTGASALSVQRILGLGSYETAWSWLQKLRRAMVRPGRERLSGGVEVDETYIGPVEKGMDGRRTRRKALIAVAAEEDGEAIGRIRMRRIPDASAESLEAFVVESVEPGTVVHTDGWDGYVNLAQMGYLHAVSRLHHGRETASEVMPRVHRVVSLLRRWLLGTHQGAASHEHLDYYLDEFTFRFNRRTSRYRGQLFHRLLEYAVQTDPVPYPSLVRDVLRHQRRRHNM